MAKIFEKRTVRVKIDVVGEEKQITSTLSKVRQELDTEDAVLAGRKLASLLDTDLYSFFAIEDVVTHTCM